MDEMVRQKDRIEAELQRLKSIQSDREFAAQQLSQQIRELTLAYNKKCEDVRRLKTEFCAQRHAYGELRRLVERYCAEERSELEGRCAAEIHSALEQINALDFPLGVGIFRRLDQLERVSTAAYPILHARKRRLREEKRSLLRTHIVGRIEEAMRDKALLSELIFYINFAVRFEAYFEEKIFVGILCSLVEGKFVFHFMSDRESNRLDKPEWVFEFLLEEYRETERVFGIYADCCARQGGVHAIYGELVAGTQALVGLKIAELARCRSDQRRALILHFASEYLRFRNAVLESYGLEVRSADLGRVMHETQRRFVKEELARIHETKYVQWFLGYQALCKDALAYVSRFRLLDPEFELYGLVRLVALHTQAFLENLSFVSREEVRIACFVYTQVLELRTYIGAVESELLLEDPASLPDDGTQKSLSKLSALAADVLKLVKSLALKDTGAVTKSLRHFNYVSAEDRRAAAVEIYRVVEDFRGCADYDRIEAEIAGCLDRFLLEDVLLRIRLGSDEYLEFRDFFMAVKKYFGARDWKADEGCRAVEALLEGKRLSGEMYRRVRALYKGGS